MGLFPLSPLSSAHCLTTARAPVGAFSWARPEGLCPGAYQLAHSAGEPPRLHIRGTYAARGDRHPARETHAIDFSSTVSRHQQPAGGGALTSLQSPSSPANRCMGPKDRGPRGRPRQLPERHTASGPGGTGRPPRILRLAPFLADSTPRLVLIQVGLFSLSPLSSARCLATAHAPSSRLAAGLLLHDREQPSLSVP